MFLYLSLLHNLMKEPVFNADLGQHFLTDTDVLHKEIQASSLSTEDKVIEIGAGRGILTEQLAKRSGEVLSFEMDSRLSAFLDNVEEENKNLKIVYGDALKYSWKGYNKIVSNIPYHLSEAIILKAVESGTDELILIVGENFKDAVEKNEDKLGIVVNTFFDFKSVMHVKKSSFSPEPRVNSWLIKLKRKNGLKKRERTLQSFLRKKGKIKNALMSALTDEGITKNQARDKIKEMGFHDAVLEKSMASITGKVLSEIRRKLEI